MIWGGVEWGGVEQSGVKQWGGVGGVLLAARLAVKSILTWHFS